MHLSFILYRRCRDINFIFSLELRKVTFLNPNFFSLIRLAMISSRTNKFTIASYITSRLVTIVISHATDGECVRHAVII